MNARIRVRAYVETRACDYCGAPYRRRRDQAIKGFGLYCSNKCSVAARFVHLANAVDKSCPECQQTKPIDAFYRTPKGKPSAICKECRKIRSRKRYLAKRADLHFQKRQRDYEVINREQKLQTLSNWRRRNREKCRAHWRRWRAERDGVLIRPNHCELCGANTALHAHHSDYSQPLEVEWFCPKCHGEWHRSVRELSRG
jgi:hypothetical protein